MVVMSAVVNGYAVVAVVVAVGVLVARWNVLGPSARQMLNRFAFVVATPALLVDVITSAGQPVADGRRLAVIAASALVTGAVVYVAVRRVIGLDRTQSVIAMLASSYVNSANLGIPLAVYVLGDAAAVIPVLVFQVAFYGPVALAVLDVLSGNRQARPVMRFAAPLRNPIVLAAACGVGVAATGGSLPPVVAEAVHMIGGAAVPVALIVFGMAVAEPPYLPQGPNRQAVAVATAAKCLLHPAVAGVIAVAVFGVTGRELVTAMVLAALPTAQNVYIYAGQYGTGQQLARDTAVVTTLAAIPVLMAITVLVPGA